MIKHSKKYPATERVNRSRKELENRGGARVQVSLSPEANKALKWTLAHTSDKTTTALVNRLILDEQERLKKK